MSRNKTVWLYYTIHDDDSIAQIIRKWRFPYLIRFNSKVLTYDCNTNKYMSSEFRLKTLDANWDPVVDYRQLSYKGLMYLKYLDTKDLTPSYTHDLVKIGIQDSGIYSDQIKGKKNVRWESPASSFTNSSGSSTTMTIVYSNNADLKIRVKCCCMLDALCLYLTEHTTVKRCSKCLF